MLLSTVGKALCSNSLQCREAAIRATCALARLQITAGSTRAVQPSRAALISLLQDRSGPGAQQFWLQAQRVLADGQIPQRMVNEDSLANVLVSILWAPEGSPGRREAAELLARLADRKQCAEKIVEADVLPALTGLLKSHNEAERTAAGLVLARLSWHPITRQAAAESEVTPILISLLNQQINSQARCVSAVTTLYSLAYQSSLRWNLALNGAIPALLASWQNGAGMAEKYFAAEALRYLATCSERVKHEILTMLPDGVPFKQAIQSTGR